MSHRSLAFTAQHLLLILRSFQPVTEYVVGFSGGADSTALLHALCTLKEQLKRPLWAIHVNHGIHQDADQWQAQCESFCRVNQVELVTLKVKLENRTGKGLEAEARRLRYTAMAELLPAGAGLLTAHHADDQAETLLLNLMRGSGVDGLSAMPECRELGNGFLLRPLLVFHNKVLKDYLRSRDVEWIEDPSNGYLNHDRNFVRHEIMPLLEQRWPRVSKRLLLTRDAMSDARHLLEQQADAYLGQNLGHPLVLKMTPQLILGPELFKLVVRRWIKQAAAAAIPVYRLEAFYQQVQHQHDEQNVTMAWGGWLLHVYRQQLWLHTSIGVAPCPDARWPEGSDEIDLGTDLGRMKLSSVSSTESGCSEPARGFEPAHFGGELSIIGRSYLADAQNGAAIFQGGHHKSLKKLYQQADIPPWLRDCIPLCRLDGELVAMGDWCFSERFATCLAEKDRVLSWQPQHPLLQYIRAQHQTPAVDHIEAVR